MTASRILVVLTDGDPTLARYLDELRRDGWRVLATVRKHEVKSLLSRHEGAIFLLRSSVLPPSKENEALGSCTVEGKRPYTVLCRSADCTVEFDGVDCDISEPFDFARLKAVLHQASGDDPVAEATTASLPESILPQALNQQEYVRIDAASIEDIGALSPAEAAEPIGYAEIRLLRWIRRCTELERDKDSLRAAAIRALVSLTASCEGRLFLASEGKAPRLGDCMGVARDAIDLPRVIRYAAEAFEDKTPRLVMGIPRDGTVGGRTSYLIVPIRHVDSVAAVAVLSGRDAQVPYGMVDLEVADHLGRQLGENFANAERQVELEQWALVDSRTGLYSQKFYETNFAKSFYNAKRHGESLSLMLIDLDFFKQVNESLGYEGGNQVLKTVAQLLFVSFRTGDLVCRWGGDEFVVILPKSGKSPDEGHTVAERIRSSVASLRIDVKANGRIETVSPSVSIGYATFPTHARDQVGLFAAANAALTRAKKVKNTVCLAEPVQDIAPSAAPRRLGHST